MYNHWYGLGFNFPSFEFWFGAPPSFPRREDYIRLLEGYKQKIGGGARGAKKDYLARLVL